MNVPPLGVRMAFVLDGAHSEVAVADGEDRLGDGQVPLGVGVLDQRPFVRRVDGSGQPDDVSLQHRA